MKFDPLKKEELPKEPFLKIPPRRDTNEVRDQLNEKWEKTRQKVFWAIILLIIINYLIFFR
jgi:hypothetical protein